MADIANLVLGVDSRQVATGVRELDGLTAAGARAEAATIGLGRGTKGAAAEATAMAAAAQASARATSGLAAGFTASTSAARLNTIAMRETLVVARELSRGNFTRIPGSLSLLAANVSGGFSGYASALANQLGLIKKVQDAELAEEATNAIAAASAVESAAQRAAANIAAADTELALAQASARVAETSTAEAAAQVRIAAAHEAVAAAAAEAAIAENALAVAEGRAAEASTASAAATRTVIGGAGIGLIGIATVAGVAFGAIKRFQEQVKDSGQLDEFAEKLRLTDAEIKKAGGSVTYLGHNIREIHGLTVTFGDVMHSVWHELGREISNQGPWNAMATAATSAFSSILSAWNKVSAGISAGLFFIIDAGKAALNGSLFTGKFDALGDLKSRYGDELKRNADAFGRIGAGAIAHREAALQTLSDGNNPAKGPRAKKENDHGLGEALDKLDADKLDAEIKGQYALAAAYGVSDAAAQRAIAHQKAAEDAIQHKGGADLFYAKELQKAVAEDVAKQAHTNADLQVQTSIRAQLNGQLANGTITIAQYNEKLSAQTVLHKLNVDLENADADHKKIILGIIADTIQLQTEQLQNEAQYQALKQIASNDNDIERMRLENSLMGASNKERAVAIAQLEALQQLKQLDPNGLLTRGERNNYVQSAIDKATASVRTPFQQWAASVPQTAAAVTEALQSIEVHGFDALAQGIAGVITGTESLGHAFRDISRQIIADIVQMTIKMLIFRATSSIFGGGFGGVKGAQDSAAFVPGFASGGSMIIGGNGGVDNNMLSLNGKPLVKVGRGEELAVYPNGGAANNNRGGPIEVHVLVDTSENLDAKVDAKVIGGMQHAVKISVDHTNSTLRALARPKLNG